MSASTTVESFISRELHSLLFLEEFTFASNKFTPPESSEVELADGVVILGDRLLITQIKERNPANVGDEEAERKWFAAKVVRDATRQIRDTLRFLGQHHEIIVPNERGDKFNLASRQYREVLKVVIYGPAPNLPNDLRGLHGYVSETAGFIHLVAARDYLEIFRTLRVPEEVAQYLNYRQFVLETFPQCVGMAEAYIAGHYVGGKPDVAPTAESLEFLHRLVQDEEEWDLTPLLRGMRDRSSPEKFDPQYYLVLAEFAKLSRAMWRKVKERIFLCVEKVRQDKWVRPYRITVRETDCGFVFIPINSEVVAGEGWAQIQKQALVNFMEGHKYDQRTSKCVGILFAREPDGTVIVNWGLVAYPWEEDAEIEKQLKENFPFREVKEVLVHGYHLTEDATK